MLRSNPARRPRPSSRGLSGCAVFARARRTRISEPAAATRPPDMRRRLAERTNWLKSQPIRNGHERNEQQRQADRRGAPKATLHLKRPVEQGTVRQSFSHGRSKAVVVEKVKRRVLGPGRDAAARRARRPAPPKPTVSLAPGKGRRPVRQRAAPKTGVVLPTLTAEQREARARALLDARAQEEEDRRRQEAEARRAATARPANGPNARRPTRASAKRRPVAPRKPVSSDRRGRGAPRLPAASPPPRHTAVAPPAGRGSLPGGGDGRARGCAAARAGENEATRVVGARPSARSCRRRSPMPTPRPTRGGRAAQPRPVDRRHRDLDRGGAHPFGRLFRRRTQRLKAAACRTTRKRSRARSSFRKRSPSRNSPPACRNGRST